MYAGERRAYWPTAVASGRRSSIIAGQRRSVSRRRNSRGRARRPSTILADRRQPLADVGVQPGVDERDRPVVDVARQQLDLPPPSREHEVVRHGLVVVRGSSSLITSALVAEAEDEVLVPEVGVVLHDVPQDRAGFRPEPSASGSAPRPPAAEVRGRRRRGRPSCPAWAPGAGDESCAHGLKHTSRPLELR